MSTSESVVLKVDHVSKTFPGTRALDDVSLSLTRGEIHALVGNNGSGKSTLIKILAGVEHADPGGRITVGARGHDADAFTPKAARAAGLHFVHQVPALFPWLTVAENLAIGRGFETQAGRIRWRDQHARARQLLERFHVRATPEMPLFMLDPADRTLVAIARALQDQEGEHEGVLILDEPTAALPGAEVERLLATLKTYAAQGQTILYVSHHLEEIIRTADRVSALRDGKHVGTLERGQIDERQIVTLMLGRALASQTRAPSPPNTQQPVLTVKNLAGGVLQDVSLTLRRGEIVGLAGIVGAGAAELLGVLFGARERSGGEVTLDGKRFTPRDPAAAIAAGLAFLPADRAADAAFASMSLRANVSAPRVGRYFRGLRLRHDLERADARAAITRFLVRAASEEYPLATLSGGNQQKIVLARWLHDKPRVLLLNEPTQGVDVHARQEIHALLRAAAGDGTAQLVVSSDFRELCELCDRVLVMSKGRIVQELSGAELDVHRLTELSHFAPSTKA